MSIQTLIKSKSSTLIFSLLSSCFAFSQQGDVTARLQNHEQGFYIDSRMDFGGRVYYNCDDVERKIHDLLEQMGAQGVNVRCHGGLDRFRPPISWESSVSLEYTTLKLSENAEEGIQADWKNVNIRSSDDCHLLRQVFLKVKNNFEIKNRKGPSACGTINKSFRIQFTTLFPN